MPVEPFPEAAIIGDIVGNILAIALRKIGNRKRVIYSPILLLRIYFQITFKAITILIYYY